MYDWHNFVDDCAGFMDAVGLRGIPVVGHSSGGATAAFLAATRPEYVSRLVLIEPIVRPPGYEGGMQRPNELSEGARKRRPVWESREEMVESYRRKDTFSAWRPEVLRLYAEHGTRRLEGGDGVSGSFELKCWPEVEAQVFENSASLDTWEVAPQIAVPTLVLVGETTNQYLRMMASGLAQRVPGARLETIEGAGHLAPMERPEAVAAMVREWLEADERK
jgi:pimeloyl-ACP methyl ester carboxylesterase